MTRKILWLALTVLATACSDGSGQRASVRGNPDGASVADAERPVVLFLGTSLTAGYGLDVEQAYPALVQEKIDRAGLGFRVVNAGVSGETSAGGLRRIDWLLREPVAVLVLELGANDGLRGLDPDAMRQNLREIIARTKRANPEVRIVIAGMEAPPNMGQRYTEAFRSVFPELAREQRAALIPFLLDGVAGRRRYNQVDGIHPTAEGHEKIADNVWDVLERVLRSAAGVY